MPLSQAQRGMWERARSIGNSDSAIALSEGMCRYLIQRIVLDLGQGSLDGYSAHVPEFYSVRDPFELTIEGPPALYLYDSLCSQFRDADTFFLCLATLQKSRLKYENIQRTQPIPSFEQIGPRTLIQYGTLEPQKLLSLLYWRKWLYDLDNRSAQETGYLFEPILAAAIGGTPVSARKSPVRRASDGGKGRQVDCIRDNRAYEFKLRVTIAASGQGRWNEELEFPNDCRMSGFRPTLIVLDSTRNEKLEALSAKFLEHGGEVYIGENAWQHLEAMAGNVMAKFIEKYVRVPMRDVVQNDQLELEDLTLRHRGNLVEFLIGDGSLIVKRE